MASGGILCHSLLLYLVFQGLLRNAGGGGGGAGGGVLGWVVRAREVLRFFFCVFQGGIRGNFFQM